MILRITLLFALVGSGCGGGGGDADGGTAPIGQACSADAQCLGEAPDCLTEGLYPIADLASSDNANARDLADVGVPLPGGYCSAQPSCAVDDDCPTAGSCFFPLRDVDPEAFEDLVGLLQLGDEDNATVLAFLDFGVCLEACADDAECGRDGYVCATPARDFLILVRDADVESTFCVGDDDPCDPQPCANGTCSFETFDAFTCECDPDWTGDLCDEPA